MSPHERVHFIQQEHQGFRAGRGPLAEHIPWSASWGPDSSSAGLPPPPARSRPREFAALRRASALRIARIAAPTSSRAAWGALYVEIDRPVAATGVQLIAEAAQYRCLSRLPGSVEDEVLLLGDQAQHRVPIQPGERGDRVVPLGLHRAGGVEEAQAPQYRTAVRARRPTAGKGRGGPRGSGPALSRANAWSPRLPPAPPPGGPSGTRCRVAPDRCRTNPGRSRRGASPRGKRPCAPG